MNLGKAAEKSIELLKVKHDETIERLLSRMEQYNIRRAIVADKNNETVGFVAMQDILKEIIVKIPTKSTKVSIIPERINT